MAPAIKYETSVDCGGVCGAQCTTLLSALVHRYSFSGSGTVATDSVGGANGTLVNASLTGTGSVSLTNTGPEQFVDPPNGIVSSLTNATFEVWLTWNGGTPWQRIFDFGTNSAGEGNRGTAQRFLMMSPEGTVLSSALLARCCGSSNCSTQSNFQEAGASSALPTGSQKHVVMVFDDSGNQMRVYLDGSPVASVAVSGTLSNLSDVNNWIGRSNYTGDPGFSGQINEFRIYDQALSVTAIQFSRDSGPDASFL